MNPEKKDGEGFLLGDRNQQTRMTNIISHIYPLISDFKIIGRTNHINFVTDSHKLTHRLTSQKTNLCDGAQKHRLSLSNLTPHPLIEVEVRRHYTTINVNSVKKQQQLIEISEFDKNVYIVKRINQELHVT